MKQPWKFPLVCIFTTFLPLLFTQSISFNLRNSFFSKMAGVVIVLTLYKWDMEILMASQVEFDKYVFQKPTHCTNHYFLTPKPVERHASSSCRNYSLLYSTNLCSYKIFENPNKLEGSIIFIICRNNKQRALVQLYNNRTMTVTTLSMMIKVKLIQHTRIYQL